MKGQYLDPQQLAVEAIRREGGIRERNTTSYELA